MLGEDGNDVLDDGEPLCVVALYGLLAWSHYDDDVMMSCKFFVLFILVLEASTIAWTFTNPLLSFSLYACFLYAAKILTMSKRISEELSPSTVLETMCHRRRIFSRRSVLILPCNRKLKGRKRGWPPR